MSPASTCGVLTAFLPFMNVVLPRRSISPRVELLTWGIPLQGAGIDAEEAELPGKRVGNRFENHCGHWGIWGPVHGFLLRSRHFSLRPHLPEMDIRL